MRSINGTLIPIILTHVRGKCLGLLKSRSGGKVTTVISMEARNTSLWSDLEAGMVQDGPRAGINPRYARPGLSFVIPVDAVGNLMDPVTAGIIPVSPTYSSATKNWVFGDWGPVETLWRNSSSYKYALSMLGFYMKPPRFVEILWDTVNYGYANEQWLDFRTLNRPTSSVDFIHGETDSNGNSVTVVGIQQWIVDGLINAGKPPSILGTAVRNLDVRLTHRMAGFVSTDGLTVVSDTFGLLPSEDVQVSLYNAPAFDTETYSGVIIEWTGNGYRVIGYDNQNPYFTVFQPNTAGPKGVLSLASTLEPNVYSWVPNTFYTVGILVNYNYNTYSCEKSHTSGSVFDLQYWTLVGAQPKQAPRVITYNLYQSTPTQVPYTTVFSTVQEVANFLLGWQAWLVRPWMGI